MRRRIGQEVRIYRPEFLQKLFLIAAVCLVGLGIMIAVHMIDREGEPFSAPLGTVLGLMVFAGLFIMGETGGVRNRFCLAVGFGETRRDFLIARGLILWGSAFAGLLFLRLWCLAETWAQARLFGELSEGLRPDILAGLSLPGMAALSLMAAGVSLAGGALLLRDRRTGVFFVMIVWAVFILGVGAMLGGEPSGLSFGPGLGLLWKRLWGLPLGLGPCLAGTAGLALAGAAAASMLRQQTF